MRQMKEYGKNSQDQNNEKEIYSLSKKEFRIVIANII